MRKYFLTLAFSFLCFFVCAQSSTEQKLAFPGAEGFGRYALGARGVANPEVYRVTNLDDSGPGSFRDAVSRPGRVVVFDVSGVVRSLSPIQFSANSYIAGHTAPGDGIAIYGNCVSFNDADNLIVRYLRIYMGINGKAGADAASVGRGSNMIFDHCSVLWGKDENFSVSQNAPTVAEADKLKNITIQHCIMGQCLLPHSMGGLIQTAGGTSIIGCLYINNNSRNPKVKGLNQFINNVVYNWGGSNGYILADSGNPSWAWMEGNYFISGPNSGSWPYTRARENFQLYARNNFVDNNKDGKLNGADTPVEQYGNSFATTPPTMVKSLSGFAAANCATCADIPKPFLPMNETLLSPDKALERVITSVGVSLPARSEIDAYLIGQLKTYGTVGKQIRDESENGVVNNIGIIKDGPKPLDSDGDGIPDAWEDANKMNKKDPKDALKVAANGYLNIENYIASISVQK